MFMCDVHVITVYDISVQRDVDAGIDYCRRKVMLVKDRVEQLSQIIQSRRDALQQIAMYIEQKAPKAS